MFRLSSLFSIAVVLAVACDAHAHGFRIDNVANKLVLHSEDPTAGALSIYKVQALLGPSTFRSNDHPGYEVDNGFLGGESIHFDVLGPLWYSSGGAPPAPSPTGVDMVISPQDLMIPGSVTVSGLSGLQTGFLIGDYDSSSGELGSFEHQLNYLIAVPSGVPTGAYALAMRLTGTNAADQPFLPSDPFVAVFNNNLALSTFNPLAVDLYWAAVPEPSAFVLASVGLVGLLAIWRRTPALKTVSPDPGSAGSQRSTSIEPMKIKDKGKLSCISDFFRHSA